MRARAVVAAAATARARVRNMGVLSRGAPGRVGPGTVYGADPATARRGDARHTLVTISLCDDAHPRATPAQRERPETHPPRTAPSSAPASPRRAAPCPPRSRSPWPRRPMSPFFDPQSPVFRAHEGGKLGVHATQPLRDRDDLVAALHPGGRRGVARHRRRPRPVDPLHGPGQHRRRHQRRHGRARARATSARSAAMPVMEGKAVLFKHFAGIDAVPVVMETGTVEELVEAIARIAPSFGGINLEDISAPRCFDIEEQLKERLDIPVFHDDQHGTAIVVLAGLLNAAKVLGRQPARPAGRRLRRRGGGRRRDAAAPAGRGARRRRLRLARHHLARPPGPHRPQGPPRGVDQPPRPARAGWGPRSRAPTSSSGCPEAPVPEEEIAADGARRRWSSRSRTPPPRCTPTSPAGTRRSSRPGRSDFPNQINNVLAFPGIFRGALDAGATRITEAMKLAAAQAIADLVAEPSAERIVPSVFQEGVAEAVATAVRWLAPSAAGSDRGRPDRRGGADPTRPTGGRDRSGVSSRGGPARRPRPCTRHRWAAGPRPRPRASEGAASSLGESSGSMPSGSTSPTSGSSGWMPCSPAGL